MQENKVKVGLIFVSLATLFIIVLMSSIFWMTDERGSISETLNQKRSLFDPYQRLKNNEIRAVNTMWEGFEERTGQYVGLFIVRYQDELEEIEKKIKLVKENQLFVVSAFRDSLISFKMGDKFRCPKKKWAWHLQNNTLRMVKLSAADVASHEMMTFLEDHCLGKK